MTPGQFALPLLGTPKFGVRLAMMNVESDVAAAMCLHCGHLELWVSNLERVRRAQEADERARERARRLHRA